MAQFSPVEFWLSLAVIGVGAATVYAVFKFGRSLSDRELGRWFEGYWALYFDKNRSPQERQHVLQEFSDVYRDYLRERNDFWDKYGQILIAILIIVVLTVLLLTKTISPEAGLPILSGIGGFAIAKSTNIANQNRPRRDQLEG